MSGSPERSQVFQGKANEYHIISAGSLLGTLLAQPKSCPVGMVNLLNLSSLTFDEFLEAVEPPLYDYYRSIQKEQPIEEIFHRRLMETCNNYFIIGGMPECVDSWIQYKDPVKVAQIQRELIEIHVNDFSRHNGRVNSDHILMVFRSIVSQLAKANEKFMYGAVRKGGRARDFEEAIEWLVSDGMLNRVYNVSKMEHFPAAFDKLDRFKLFVFDTGLLKQMAGIDNSAILLKSDYQFKGPLTENYVLQQLRGQFDAAPRYYSDKNGEIDFVLQYGTEIIPIEAKGGEGKSAPSFKRYIAGHQTEHALRFSRRGYQKTGILPISRYIWQKNERTALAAAPIILWKKGPRRYFSLPDRMYGCDLFCHLIYWINRIEAKSMEEALQQIKERVVNDYFTPNIKAEVILNTLLTPYITKIIESQMGAQVGSLTSLTKEMSIQEKGGPDNRGTKIDYVLEDEKSCVYLVELKTTNGSISSNQIGRYIDNCCGKTFGEALGDKLLKIVRDKFPKASALEDLATLQENAERCGRGKMRTGREII